MRLFTFCAVIASISASCVTNNRTTECNFPPGSTESLHKICDNEAAKKTSSLKILDYKEKNIGKNPFATCSQVITISIASSDIVTLNAESFVNLAHLKGLHLYSNSLISIESNALLDLPLLENITLKDNSIDSLGKGVFKNLPSLKVLNLHGNKLKEFSASYLFEGPSNLHTLILQKNNISDVTTTSFHGLERLKEIDLGLNPIKHIGENAFANLPRLKRLNLKRNKMSQSGYSWDTNRIKHFSAPYLLQNSTHLEELDLTMNDITEISNETFSGLPHLKTLQLTFNKLANIHESAFANMNYLKTLSLSWNPLRNFSSCLHFKTISGLENLHLAGNGIINVTGDSFKCVPHLKHLDIRTSPMGANLPKNIFANMPELKVLVLEKSDLQEFNAPDYLKNSTNVEKLNLGFNKITTVTSRSFEGLPYLKELILEYNLISSIGERTFHFNKDLEILDLSHNKIASFQLPPKDTNYLPKLKELNLLKNPFTVDPSKFFTVLPALEKMRIFEDEWYCKCLNDTLMGVPSSKNVILYNDDEEYPNYKLYGMPQGINGSND